ncbi:MAG: SDR family oxidoreductase [Alphaproteobacteria bacterium]|nr:SDR family oxidoreductase [Alphaproteobacteria bacterium]
MTNRTVLIAGATGVVGGYLLRHFAERDDWRTIAVSRRAPDVPGRYTHIAADLLDPADAAAKLAGLSGLTHVLFAAYVARDEPAALVDDNLALFRNLLDAVEPAAENLQHVHLVQGSKYYGCHLGPYKTPAKEDDPRHLPPNFYYDQQDHMTARQEGKRWTWSICRPHGISGFSVGSPMNLTLNIAVYAAILRELGMPLEFPGTPGNYRAVYQCTDCRLLARAIEWMSTEPDCANQAFNITNGDFIRWEHSWPKIARWFGMEPGRIRTMRLADVMPQHAGLWAGMQKQYGLQPYAYESLVNWNHGDFVFQPDWDIMSSTTKARRFGFHDVVDTDEMLIGLLEEYRAGGVIP